MASMVGRFLAGTGLLLLGTTLAQASGITQIFTAPVGNDTVEWDSLGTNNTPVPNDSTVQTANGDTVTISFGVDGGEIYRQGATWQGTIPQFTSSSYILSTGDTTGGPDTLTLTFAAAISQFGVDIQDFDYSLPFTASITTTSIDGDVTFTQTSANGSAVFLGVKDSNGANISAVTFDITQSSPGISHYLGLGSAELTEASTTPEPASLPLVASGIAALVWKARRRSRA